MTWHAGPLSSHMFKKMGTRHTDPCHINERMTISEQISGLFQVCPGFMVIKTIIGRMMFNNLDKTHDAPTENLTAILGKFPLTLTIVFTNVVTKSRYAIYSIVL